MPWVESLDWTSLNALRKYPIREGLNAISSDGLFTIPNTLIVDFSLCASSDVSKRFYISQIFNAIDSVAIQISDFDDVVVGSFEIQQNLHTQDKDYYLTATTDYAGAAGKITIGVLNDLVYQPAGTHIFSKYSTEFEPRTIIPGLDGVDRIIFTDSLNNRYAVTGSVMITTRTNLNLTQQGSQILLDAGDGLGLNKACNFSTCVKSINGVYPDPDTGNISLLGLNCLRVSSPSDYTIALTDTCCTPCSGCDDLAELTNRLTSLENNFLTLRDGYNKVDNQLNLFLATINSSCSCGA